MEACSASTYQARFPLKTCMDCIDHKFSDINLFYHTILITLCPIELINLKKTNSSIPSAITIQKTTKQATLTKGVNCNKTLFEMFY